MDRKQSNKISKPVKPKQVIIEKNVSVDPRLSAKQQRRNMLQNKAKEALEAEEVMKGYKNKEMNDISEMLGSSLNREPCYIKELVTTLAKVFTEPVEGDDVANKDYVDGAAAQEQVQEVVYLDTVNGFDDNDGLTPETAFQTIFRAARYNARCFTILCLPGCVIDLADDSLICGKTLLNVVGSNTFTEVVPGITLTGSTVSTPAGSVVLNATGAGLVPNAHDGQFVEFTSGTFAGQKFGIVSNAADSIIVAGNILTAGLTDTISIVKPETQLIWNSENLIVTGGDLRLSNTNLVYPSGSLNRIIVQGNLTLDTCSIDGTPSTTSVFDLLTSNTTLRFAQNVTCRVADFEINQGGTFTAERSSVQCSQSFITGGNSSVFMANCISSGGIASGCTKWSMVGCQHSVNDTAIVANSSCVSLDSNSELCTSTFDTNSGFSINANLPNSSVLYVANGSKVSGIVRLVCNFAPAGNEFINVVNNSSLNLSTTLLIANPSTKTVFNVSTNSYLRLEGTVFAVGGNPALYFTVDNSSKAIVTTGSFIPVGATTNDATVGNATSGDIDTVASGTINGAGWQSYWSDPSSGGDGSQLLVLA